MIEGDFEEYILISPTLINLPHSTFIHPTIIFQLEDYLIYAIRVFLPNSRFLPQLGHCRILFREAEY